MQFYDNVVDLIGRTPLVRLGSVTAHLGPDAPLVLAKVEYLNPGGSVKDRIAPRDDRRRRGVRRAEARRDDRRADVAATPASGWRWSPQQRGYQCVFVCPDKVSQRQDRRAARRTAPRSWSARPRSSRRTRARTTPCRDRLAREIAGRLEAEPVRQPEQPALALRDDRSGDLGADRRADHALRRRRRHRRHDQRHRPLPQGGQRRPGPGRSAPTRRARSTPAAPAGRTWSRASARTSGRRRTTATVCDEIVAVSDRDSFVHDPPAGPRGGPARRRLLRHGGAGRARGRRPRRPGRRRRRAAARRRPRLPVEGVQRRVDGRLRLPHDRRRARRSATCCAASPASCRSSCTPTRTRRCARRSTSCASTRVSQMPVVKAEPPVMAAEVVGSVVERDLLDALFAGRAHLADPVEHHMSAAAADDRRGRAGRAPRSGALETADAAVVVDDGRPVGRPHPAGPARLPDRLRTVKVAAPTPGTSGAHPRRNRMRLRPAALSAGRRSARIAAVGAVAAAAVLATLPAQRGGATASRPRHRSTQVAAARRRARRPVLPDVRQPRVRRPALRDRRQLRAGVRWAARAVRSCARSPRSG